jgi:TIR domain
VADNVWVFLSYAHDDNLPTGGGLEEEGFVSFLQRMLEVKLKDLGSQESKLWRDAKRFGSGDPYDVEIEDALKKSALLLVVMSKNWLSRPYCRKELDDFIRFRQNNGVQNFEERIVVVGKQYVPKDKRPAALQVQEGFAFYERDAEDEVTGVKSFFNLGKSTDDRFFEVRDGLAIHLQKRISRISEGAGTGTTLRPDVSIAAANGRTVYLAKPAADMEQAYNRLALELQGRGYSVTPDVSSNIPNTRAIAYIDDALGKSELSIHLVGEKPGFAPDDDAPRIVKLQLIRARARAAASVDAGGPRFRRIVWVPKVVEACTPGSAPVSERDPIEVLSRIDEQGRSDMIEGDVLNKFLESLFQYLTQTAPQRAAPSSAGDDVQVFLDFNPRDDEEYGLTLAAALNNSPLSIVIPATGEPAPEARNFNRDKLAKCDGVLLCWGQASEVWVRAEADRLNNWQDLGRTQQFAHRSLIVGPPPALRKKALNLLFQKNQFDKFVDLTEKGAPTGDLLIGLAPARKAAQP